MPTQSKEETRPRPSRSAELMTDGEGEREQDALRMLERERDRLACQLADARSEVTELRGYVDRLERRGERMAQEIDELTAEINEMRLGPPPERPQAGWTKVDFEDDISHQPAAKGWRQCDRQ